MLHGVHVYSLGNLAEKRKHRQSRVPIGVPMTCVTPRGWTRNTVSRNFSGVPRPACGQSRVHTPSPVFGLQSAKSALFIVCVGGELVALMTCVTVDTMSQCVCNLGRYDNLVGNISGIVNAIQSEIIKV